MRHPMDFRAKSMTICALRGGGIDGGGMDAGGMVGADAIGATLEVS